MKTKRFSIILDSKNSEFVNGTIKLAEFGYKEYIEYPGDFMLIP